MTSTYTTNKHIEKPGHGDYVDSWDTPVNSDWGAIDNAFGGVTYLNVTSVSGTVVLSSSQYQPPTIRVSGTLTADVNYQIPSGIGGGWTFANDTTGANSVTISSGGAGTTVVVPQGFNVFVVSDGTNIFRSDTIITSPGGSSGQVQYNNAGSFGGSSNFTFDGTNVSVGGTITGSSVSDAAGNVRTVPVNTQGGTYSLQASDVGKYVAASSSVTIPAGVFSAGDNITIYNVTSSSISIIQDSGATLRLVGTPTTGNRTLAQYGLATVLCTGSNTFVITGGGLS